MGEPMHRHRLLQTDSIQELAGFPDTHNVTELEDELEGDREHVFDRQADMTVHLDTADGRRVGSAVSWSADSSGPVCPTP